MTSPRFGIKNKNCQTDPMTFYILITKQNKIKKTISKWFQQTFIIQYLMTKDSRHPYMWVVTLKRPKGNLCRGWDQYCILDSNYYLLLILYSLSLCKYNYNFKVTLNKSNSIRVLKRKTGELTGYILYSKVLPHMCCRAFFTQPSKGKDENERNLTFLHLPENFALLGDHSGFYLDELFLPATHKVVWRKKKYESTSL